MLGTLDPIKVVRRIWQLGLLSWLALNTTAILADDPQPPNVLLIMTDDQGWGDIHSHANPNIDTPNLDGLAESGARFDRFYVSPVCAPTRAALLTGRWHPRTGVFGVTRGAENMRADEVTVAELLKQAGYRTGIFGKWHNGANYPHDPNGQGFDEFLGFCAGHWNLYFDSPLQHNQEMTRGEGFIIDHLTDHAIEFMQSQDSHQPWFCYVPFNTPHTPWQVPDAFYEKYQDRGLEETTACAYAMVENIDTNVGRMLEALDNSNQRERTLVIFLTDNGANTDRWDGNMRGQKGSLHEGGTRVPLFVSMPGTIPAGQSIETLASHIDLLPTIMDLTKTHLDPSLAVDGKSLRKLLMGEEDEALRRRTLFTHWKNRGAVRTPEYRLVAANRTGDRWMLFDMVDDPAETTDLFQSKPEVAAELLTAYNDWWRDVSARGFDAVATHVGHEEAPTVRLRGHEARLSPSGISYFGKNGWANDWISQWQSAEGFASWPIRVVNAGDYEVRIRYAAGRDTVGDTLILHAGEEELRWSVPKAFQSASIETQDRIGRKESPPRTWHPTSMGLIRLTTAAKEIRLSRESDGAPIDIKAIEISIK